MMVYLEVPQPIIEISHWYGANRSSVRIRRIVRSWNKKLLVLWLNGRPGSVLSVFKRHGPIRGGWNRSRRWRTRRPTGPSRRLTHTASAVIQLQGHRRRAKTLHLRSTNAANRSRPELRQNDQRSDIRKTKRNGSPQSS